jgi:hypothetical protein
MTVSGLVLTIVGDASQRAAVLERLRADPRLTLGPPVADRWPLAAETDDLRAGEALVRTLEAVPGVARVDVVSVDFSEDA